MRRGSNNGDLVAINLFIGSLIKEEYQVLVVIPKTLKGLSIKMAGISRLPIFSTLSQSY